MKLIVDRIIDELDAGRCLRDIEEYWLFRSTVPGPGLRQASEFLARRYREVGLEAEVRAYPADDRTPSVDGRRNPLMWTPRSASLEVVAPTNAAGVVCSYAHEPLSLICNSTSTPPDGIEAAIVEIAQAHLEASYEGIDVAGKAILTSSMSYEVEPLARKHGALGILTDCICPPWLYAGYPPPRQPEDAPDLTMWATFSGRTCASGLWGFSLTPRQGRRLRELLRRSAEPVMVRVAVDADLAPGTSELVDALLPGTDRAAEEIWVLTHSSEPGAEDNASGCCMAVEAARALKTLISAGKLPPLRRSIRFLSAVEVDGYLPYLAERADGLHRVLAGIAPDCIGNDFARCGGRMELVRTPDANPSYVDSVLKRCFQEVAAIPNERFTPDTYAMYLWEIAPFQGNDAFISDAYFDIPTLQVSTWPERFYHSALDTPDKLSLNTLGRSGAIVALYLYQLATADGDGALRYLALATGDWKQRICAELAAEHGSARRLGGLSALATHLGLLATEAVRDIVRLAPDDERLRGAVEYARADLVRFAEMEAQATAALGAGSVVHGDISATFTLTPSRNGAVYRRLRWNAPGDGALSEDGRVRLKALREREPRIDRVWEWINGRRTAVELWAHMQVGSSIERDALEAYLALMLQEGHLTIAAGGVAAPSEHLV